MRKYINGNIVPIILGLSLILAAGWGWVFNIIKLADLLSSGFTGHELIAIFRVIGVFAAPIGAVLGYF